MFMICFLFMIHDNDDVFVNHWIPGCSVCIASLLRTSTNLHCSSTMHHARCSIMYPDPATVAWLMALMATKLWFWVQSWFLALWVCLVSSSSIPSQIIRVSEPRGQSPTTDRLDLTHECFRLDHQELTLLRFPPKWMATDVAPMVIHSPQHATWSAFSIQSIQTELKF